jgi:hypothetical protein
MPAVLTDEEIEGLISETKPLQPGWRTRLRPRPKGNRRHAERELPVRCPTGHDFRVIVRESQLNKLDFSVILVYQDRTGAEYTLLRCNGRHPSRHTNHVEKARGDENHTFGPCFHVHRATERYQVADHKIDGYAEESTDYDSLEGALEVFLGVCGFEEPPSPQPRLL